MSLRRYAIFDRAMTAADRSVEQGGVLLNTDIPTLLADRGSRSTFGVDNFVNFAEFIIFGDPSAINDTAPRIGVCTSGHGINDQLGENEFSLSYMPLTGELKYDGAVESTFSTTADVCVVGVLIEFSEVSVNIGIYLDGMFAASYSFDPTDSSHAFSGQDLFVAADLGSSLAPGDVQIFFNSGQRRFEYPSSLSEGFYQMRTIPDAIRVSESEYLSRPDDSPPNTRWRGAITAKGLTINRGVHYWVWGDQSNARGSAISIEVNDPTGLWDRALAGIYRDQPMELVSVEANGTLYEAEVLGSFTFEKMVPNSDLSKTFIGRDALALLEVPLQRRKFRPDYTGGSANRPWPTTIGACFSVEAVLIDELDYTYAMDSEGVENIGRIRDSGDPFDGVNSPVDYVINLGAQTFTLSSVPAGIITFDASVTGDAYVGSPDSPPPDELNTDGNPFAGVVGGPPTNWTASGLYPPVIHTGGGRVKFPQDYFQDNYIKHNSATLLAGKQYKFTIRIDQMIGYTTVISQNIIGLASGPSPFSMFWSLAGVPQSDVASLIGTYTGTYAPAFDHEVYIYYKANNRDSLVTGLTLIGCLVGMVEIVEIIPIDEDLGDDIIEEALDPLPLAPMLRQILQVRGGFPSSFWSEADAAAIDYETGYAGQGFHSRDQIQIRQAVDSVLLGYTASIYLDRNGVVRISRLRAPENETATFELSLNDFIGDLVPYRDDAPGLTRDFGVRRNERPLTEGELATDEVDVDMRLRKKLSRRHRYVVTSGAPLAPGYEHAEAQDPLDSRFVRIEDGQAEIDRINELYTVDRGFFKGRVWLKDSIDVDAIGTVSYPKYGLASGLNLLVVDMTEDRVNNQAEVLLWGLLPEED